MGKGRGSREAKVNRLLSQEEVSVLLRGIREGGGEVDTDLDPDPKQAVPGRPPYLRGKERQSAGRYPTEGGARVDGREKVGPSPRWRIGC
jgi:hypothetical protein